MKANLIAVQARTELADYRSGEAFHAKMASLMQAAAREADFALPTLVSYPELVGMFLSFVPVFWDDLEEEATLETAATKIVMKNFARLSEEDRKTPETAARRLLGCGKGTGTPDSQAESCGFAQTGGRLPESRRPLQIRIRPLSGAWLATLGA